jgi:uncharacterized membrane protein
MIETARLDQPNLQLGHLFGRSWETFKQHWLLMIGVFLVYSLIVNGGQSVFDRQSVLGSIAQLVVLIIHGPLLAGVYLVALRLTRGEPANFQLMFEGFQRFGKAVGVFLLTFLAFVIGFILLIVPGIIVAAGLLPAMLLVMDSDDPGVMNTLRRAWEMTKGYKMAIFLVGLALFGLNLLGMLALVIGVIFTAAFSILVIAAVYDELSRAA